MDEANPFSECESSDQIGYSWPQIKVSFPAYKGIANVALKLHNSGISEASCERTISSQKLIYNARRRHCKKHTLDARLILMRAGIK